MTEDSVARFEGYFEGIKEMGPDAEKLVAFLAPIV